MIIVHGTLSLAPEAQVYREFVESARRSGPAARAEAGNIAYVYAADLHDSSRLHLFEIWRSQSALDEHRAEPIHVQRMSDLKRWGLMWDRVQVYDAEQRV